MVKLMRKFQQPMMVFVTVIIIICFAWFYNTSSTHVDRGDADIAGKVYGRTVTGAEFKRVGRKLSICQMLGLNDLMRNLAYSGNPTTRNGMEENYVWNSMILRHEADALGIAASPAEIVDAVQKIPGFATNGVYDSTKYTQFVQNGLAPNGFTTDLLEELVGDSLRLEKIKALLGATDQATMGEIRALYAQRNQKTDASVIRLKLEDFKKDVKVSDEDVQKRFEEKKATLQHPEKRKVKFVSFALADAQKALMGRERNIELQKLADQSNNIAVALAEKGAKIEEVAAKAGVPVKETAEFELDVPGKEIDGSSAVAEAAFKLTDADPHSDATKSEADAYYVLELSGITPATPKTLDEAKAQLTAELIAERANEALTLKGAELRKKIADAVAAGKSFADAAKEAGATVEAFPTFSPAERPKADQPDAQKIVGRSAEMGEGELSEFSPTQAGGILIHIDKRLPVEEAGFEKEKTMLATDLEGLKKEAAFQQWLKERRIAAGFVEAKS